MCTDYLVLSDSEFNLELYLGKHLRQRFIKRRLWMMPDSCDREQRTSAISIAVFEYGLLIYNEANVR
jgi:hypothetical protein